MPLSSMVKVKNHNQRVPKTPLEAVYRCINPFGVEICLDSYIGQKSPKALLLLGDLTKSELLTRIKLSSILKVPAVSD